MLQRVSCRDFTAQDVEDEKIELLLRAAMQAPSANNEQPWEFLVVRKAESKAYIGTMSPYSAPASKAPVVLLALANLERISTKSVWWIQDMSACIENILLEASEIGLGAVWLGIYPRESRVLSIQEYFSLPGLVVPVAAIAIGYAREEKQARQRFDRKRVYLEKYAP